MLVCFLSKYILESISYKANTKHPCSGQDIKTSGINWYLSFSVVCYGLVKVLWTTGLHCDSTVFHQTHLLLWSLSKLLPDEIHSLILVGFSLYLFFNNFIFYFILGILPFMTIQLLVFCWVFWDFCSRLVEIRTDVLSDFSGAEGILIFFCFLLVSFYLLQEKRGISHVHTSTDSLYIDWDV